SSRLRSSAPTFERRHAPACGESSRCRCALGDLFRSRSPRLRGNVHHETLHVNRAFRRARVRAGRASVEITMALSLNPAPPTDGSPKRRRIVVRTANTGKVATLPEIAATRARPTQTL